MNLFGTTDALITIVTALIGGAMFLGGAVFRKIVNDLLGLSFSLIGSTAVGVISYIIFSQFLAIKYSIMIAIVLWLVGGFGMGFLLPDGESSGDGEMEVGGGNYEE